MDPLPLHVGPEGVGDPEKALRGFAQKMGFNAIFCSELFGMRLGPKVSAGLIPDVDRGCCGPAAQVLLPLCPSSYWVLSGGIFVPRAADGWNRKARGSILWRCGGTGGCDYLPMP